MVLLKGSCACNAVNFELESHTLYPYNWCYCNQCRKTQGGGGFSINIMGDTDTFKITKGEDSVKTYQAQFPTSSDSSHHKLETSPHQRRFCGACGSHLWAFDNRWAQWIYPLASAIDTPLPEPSEIAHFMTDFKASWVPLPHDETYSSKKKEEEKEKKGDDVKHQVFSRYPEEGIEDWHKKRHLYQ